ncbi:MAG: hypothetical protein ACXVPQ_03315 [Bacteroidia bacterium]
MLQRAQLFFLVVISQIAFAQYVQTAERFGLTIPVPQGWTIIHQAGMPERGGRESLHAGLERKRTLQDTGRLFLKLTVYYGPDSACTCDFGTRSPEEQVNVSGYAAKRWFATDCNWTKHAAPSGEEKVIGYAIQYLVKISDKFLMIDSGYFSRDPKQKVQLEEEIINFVNNIKIKTL